MSPNPFTPAQPVPPERFVGRIYEIDAACYQIHSRGHVAIWGDPGMGKRSLLLRVSLRLFIMIYNITVIQIYVIFCTISLKKLSINLS